MSAGWLDKDWGGLAGRRRRRKNRIKEHAQYCIEFYDIPWHDNSEACEKKIDSVKKNNKIGKTVREAEPEGERQSTLIHSDT